MFGNSMFGFSGAGGGGGGGSIGGSGTLNYLAKFTPDGTTIGNSLLFDNGVSVGLGTITPSASAIFELTSTTKGFLVPRMTTIQRDSIATPVNALLIYNLTTSFFNYWNGLTWIEFSGTVITTPFAPSNTAIVVGDDFQEVSEKAQGQINYIISNYAVLNSPAFIGTPTAPTQAVNDNSTKLATTAFVSQAISNNTAVSNRLFNYYQFI